MKSVSMGLAVVVASLFATLAWSQSGVAKRAYKCVDTQGRIAYRELPMAEMHCVAIRGVIREKTEQQAKQAMADLRDKIQTREQTNQQADSGGGDQRSKNCNLARQNLATLESDSAIVQTDAEGNKVVLNDEQRSAAREKTHKDIDYWCS